MSKRHLFVILSGIITAAAISGWYHDNAITASEDNRSVNTEVVDVLPVSADSEVIPTMNQNNAAERIDSSLNTLIRQVNQFAEQEQVRAMLEKSEETTVIRLVDPEHAPDITGKPAETTASDNLPAAYDALKQLSKDLGSSIIVDLAHHRILQSDDDEVASRILEKIGESTEGEGFVMHDTAQGIELTVFKCLDDAREHCIAVLAPLTISADESMRCDLAANSILKCGDFVADSKALYQAGNCDDAPITGLQDLLDSDKNEGVLESDGEKYKYRRTVLKSGCVVAELMSKAEAQAPTAPQLIAKPEPPAPSVSASVSAHPTWKLKHYLAAGGGGLLMILLGLWATRGQNQNAPKNAELLGSEANREAEERKALLAAHKDDEIISLKAKIAELESEVDTANTQNRTLQQELNDSRMAKKQEELRSLSLEQEKKELEDALAAAESRNTEIAKMRDLDNDSINHALLKDDSEPIPDAEPPKASGTLDVKTNALFDALSEDDWDDIADSFDMIMSPSAPDNPAADDQFKEEKVPTDLLNGESSFGLTGFLSNISDSDKRNKLSKPEKTHNTETRLKPIGDTPKLNDLPPILTPKPAKTGNTLPPVKPVPSLSDSKLPSLADSKLPSLADSKLPSLSDSRLPDKPKDVLSLRTVERPVIDSASELAMRQDNKENDSSSFKPAPSWTGKKVIETGMDTNSLAEALKRRARDVSEVALPAISSDPNEAARNLSKSGVFSVTGSRVDINPLSDNEYFKSLYEKFVQCQNECGEPTKFTQEQFVSRLAREKSHLMQNYKCKNVRFQVYIKDGKTSLKAMPQK